MCLQAASVPSASPTAPAPSAPTAPSPTLVAAGPTVPAPHGIRPSSSEISRIITPESRHYHYTIDKTGEIEEAFGGLEIIAGLVYVHGGDSNGVLAPAAGDAYLGRTRKFLTEKRSVGEQEIPFLIGETPKSEPQSARIYVRGTAGDKLLLIYR